ncbi:MAG: hypothetical protein EON98_15315, partial [Chitinophagaceae bacterium]
MNKVLTIACLLFLYTVAHTQSIVTDKKTAGAFPVVSAIGAASIVYDTADDSLVLKAASLFQSDIEQISGQKPQLFTSIPTRNIILIGSIGKSRFIQQ